MHKEYPCAKLWIDDYGFKVLKFYTDRFPCTSEPILHKWFSVRQTPYGAGNLADAYKFSCINTFIDYMRLTHFTSINDCFWVMTDKSQTWESVNLYKNPFTRCLEDIFMGRYLLNDNKTLNSIYSPCFTNGGSFPKIYRHRGRDIFCIKGSRKEVSGELKDWFVYSEILVSQLYRYLKIPHVDYTLTEYKGSKVCISKVFTNECLEYYPAVYYLNGYPCYETVRKMFGKYELFYVMLLLDCITFNKDRHTGNYGVVVSDGNILGMNPVYDNNYALFPDLSVRKITRSDFHLLHNSVRSRLDNEPFDTLAVKVLNDYPKGKSILEKLLDFKFEIVGDAQSWRIEKVNQIIHAQCRHILSMVER